jgi:predicted O-methyltransferase YrrM
MLYLIKSFLRDLKNFYFPKKHPFGEKILADKEYYISKHLEAKNKIYVEIDNFEKITSFKIEKDWLDNLALHTQVVKKKSEINYQHGRILYSALRKYIKKNKIKFLNVLEIGTALGYSSICMSKAINDSKTLGNIVSLDIISGKNKIYWNCIDDHQGPKTRDELLSTWKEELKNISFLTGPSSFTLKKFKKDRINFAYIDGMHDYLNVNKEFNFISSRQISGDIVILDDVNEKFPEVIKFIKDQEKLAIYNVEKIKSSEDRAYAICEKK